MSEFVVIVLVHLSGWALLRALGLRDWGAVPLGFIAGVFGVIVLTFAFVVAGADTTPSSVLTALALVGGVALVLQRRVLDAAAYLTVAATSVGLVGAVVVLREAHVVSYHIDSFRYLMSATLLASNTFGEFATANLLTKRMLVTPAMHSLAHAYGEHYVRSLTPLLAIACLGALTYVLVTYHSRAATRRPVAIAWLAGVLAAALLLSINRYVFHAVYINAHLTVGAALLMTAAGGLLLVGQRLTRHERPAVTVLVALSLAVTIVGRPEGFLFAGIALLPIVLAREVTLRERALLTIVYGASMLGWHGYVWLTLGSRATLESIGPAVLGALVLLAAPLHTLPGLTTARRVLLTVVFLALTVTFSGFSVLRFDPLQRSLVATYQNVVAGAGGWGLSLLMLAPLAVVAGTVALRREPSADVVWYPLASSPLLFFLLVFLREGAFRVGDGDSLNRMLIQVVPLAVLLVGIGIGATRTPGLADAAEGSFKGEADA